MSEARCSDRPWWQDAVVYEIASVSFQDSNGDGRGDLPGLLQRIGYLQWLGVNVVWLTPVCPTPFRDFGYDISDFCAIDARLGTLDDFDRVLKALHGAGIRLILDLVPNHTSSEHPWFIESRSSRTNQRSDWYIWADASENGGPPNNWLSRFGGSAWQWDETRRQYYYHSFLVEQPDLNWRSGEVRAAMFDVMRFWLERGVDGFRVDASAVLIKDDLLRDNPANPDANEGTPPPQRSVPVFTDDRPETMDCLEDLRAVVDAYGDRLLCGEVQGKTDRIGHFYGNDRPRLHLPLNFALLDAEWNAFSLQAAIDAYMNAIPRNAWPVWVIGGHDKQRIASRIGQGQARVLAMLLLTLQGTPFFYMGDELGAERVSIPAEMVQDPFEKLVPGYGLGRDPERSPMRWDDSGKGGFTTGEPWLPLPKSERNVAEQKRQPNSLLQLYRALIELRRSNTCLSQGEYRARRSSNDILVYERVDGDNVLLIALNTVDQPRRWFWQGKGMRLLSTDLDGETPLVEGPLLLDANEGVIVSPVR
jgi:alpha-glucosidase